MREDCHAAQRSIRLEQYIVHDDAVGKSFLDVLTEKARAGIRVQLILDAVGSRGLEDTPEIAALRNSGGEVAFYRPIWWLQLLFPMTWFPREHCKTLIIDREIAYLGGVCLRVIMQGWRDTQLRIEGAIAQTIDKDFQTFWDQLGKLQTAPPSLPPMPQAPVEYLPSHAGHGHPRLYNELCDRIDSAEQHIRIATPYLFPPRRLMKALRRASRRGVTVELLVSKRADVPFADRVIRFMLPRFLHYGITIWFYSASVFHAKYAVIDDDWATVGSSNFDHLSFRHNRESNLVLRNVPEVQELKQHFLKDVALSRAATLEDWREQPWRHRLVGWLGTLVYEFL